MFGTLCHPYSTSSVLSDLTRFLRASSLIDQGFRCLLRPFGKEGITQPCHSQSERYHDELQAWYSGGTIPPTGTSTATRASKPPAQRGRTRARNVAMPNSKGPRIIQGPDIFHSVGRIPRSISLGMLVNIPMRLATKAGDSVRRGSINASTKEKPHTSVIQTLNRQEANQAQPTGSFTCRA